MVKMLRVDIRHNGGCWLEARERAITFISFDHHPLAISQLGITAPALNNATIDHGRVDLRRIQQGCHKRRCGRFPMCPCDRNRPSKAHQLA